MLTRRSRSSRVLPFHVGSLCWRRPHTSRSAHSSRCSERCSDTLIPWPCCRRPRIHPARVVPGAAAVLQPRQGETDSPWLSHSSFRRSGRAPSRPPGTSDRPTASVDDYVACLFQSTNSSLLPSREVNAADGVEVLFERPSMREPGSVRLVVPLKWRRVTASTT